MAQTNDTLTSKTTANRSSRDLALERRIPIVLASATVVICVAPFVLNRFGVDFGSAKVSLDLGAAATFTPLQLADALHHTLRGAFTHTILEWTAFCTAMFTVLVAFAHFRIKHDVVVPIIAVSLACAGFMDAFHTLAADRLIHATAETDNLIPFTWAICRVFNALILLTGVGVVLLWRRKQDVRGDFAFVLGISAAFAVVAYGVIHACAVSNQLPQTMFPNSVVTRPWDFVPLLLFLFAGAVAFPILHKRRRDEFSLALWVSAIPQVFTQLHMAFGSTALFDNHFNIAHSLKIFAYFVPFVGLLLNYMRTQREELRLRESLLYRTGELESQITEREQAEERLQSLAETLEQRVDERTAEVEERASELQRTNADLERFNRLAVGRELRMVELKREVNGLVQASGEQPRYNLREQDELQTKGDGHEENST